MQILFHQRATLILLLAAFVLASLACRSSPPRQESIVIINAPTAGVVHRILVGEGVAVKQEAEILELAQAIAASPATTSHSEGPTQATAEKLRSEIIAAQQSVERASIEVQRIEPLVAAGSAPQPQLDAARAQYQQAQEQLQKAQARAQAAQINIILQQGNPATAPPKEKLIMVRAPAAGTIRVVSVRIGQQVSSGQPLASLSIAR